MTDRRKDNNPRIERIPDTTWFGACVLHVTAALRDLSVPGRFILLHDLQAYLRRQESELNRHQRNKTGGCSNDPVSDSRPVGHSRR
jgi:hypothetical protein